MRTFIAAAIAIAVSTAVFGAEEPPRSYSAARVLWEHTKGNGEYQAYASEFAQYNNHFHLDSKDGCYTLGSESVGLMLVITRPDGAEYALVENVLSDVDTPKARCFIKTYRGLRTKVPPFLPFVLQMAMG